MKTPTPKQKELIDKSKQASKQCVSANAEQMARQECGQRSVHEAAAQKEAKWKMEAPARVYINMLIFQQSLLNYLPAWEAMNRGSYNKRIKLQFKLAVRLP